MFSSFLQDVELHGTISHSFCLFFFSLIFKREISLFVCPYMANHDSNFNAEGTVQINTEQPNFVTATGL